MIFYSAPLKIYVSIILRQKRGTFNYEKKGMTKILALCAVVAASAAVFVGCGSAEPAPTSSTPESSAVVSTIFEDEGVAGAWELATMIVDGKETTLKQYCADNGVDIDEITVTMTLNEDGTGASETLGISTPFNYEVDENEVTCITEVPNEDGTTEELVSVYTYDAESDTLNYMDESGENGSVMVRADEKRV